MSVSVAAHRRLIAGLGLGQIMSWGAFYYAFPLMAGPTAEALGVGKLEVYGAASLGLALSVLATYPIGRGLDRGHGRALMSWGGFGGGLLLLAWAAISEPWQLYPLLAGLGLVQAMTLYEAAQAVIMQRRLDDPRSAIIQLTLWGGFASTVFVPLTQLLIAWLDWRGALVALGLMHLVLGFALHRAVIPQAPPPQGHVAAPVARGVVRWVLRQPVFWALLLSFTVYQGVFAGLSLHLYPLLLERGASAATAVAVIAVIGPAQVAARFLIWRAAGRASARAIGLVSVLLLPASLLWLRFAPPGLLPLAAFGALMGAGVGAMTIVRGLAVSEMLTREGYGAINGLLAGPATIAKALAPLAAAALWTLGGSYAVVVDAALLALVAMTLAFAYAALHPPPVAPP